MTHEDRHEALNALLDGELTATETAELAAHLAGCPACVRDLAELAELRLALAAAVPEETIAEDFLLRITARLDGVSQEIAADRSPTSARIIPLSRRMRSKYLGAIVAGVAAAAIAASLVIVLARPAKNTVDLAAVHDAMLRTTYSAIRQPATAPLALAGYRVVGSRSDVLAGHKALVVTYEGAAGTITLCSWAANGEPAHGVKAARYRGAPVVYWNDGATEYWATSDGANSDLASFVAQLRERA